MSGRRDQLVAADVQHRIGLEVIEARSRGVGWKALERVFGRERTQLWRYAVRAATGMQQQSLGMQHLQACAAATAPVRVSPDHEAAIPLSENHP